MEKETHSRQSACSAERAGFVPLCSFSFTTADAWALIWSVGRALEELRMILLLVHEEKQATRSLCIIQRPKRSRDNLLTSKPSVDMGKGGAGAESMLPVCVPRRVKGHGFKQHDMTNPSAVKPL